MTGVRESARVLVVQQEDGTGAGLVGEALAEAGLSLEVFHPWAGQALPAELGGWAGLLVLGGAPNCEDDAGAPWLPVVRVLVREAVEREVPLLGICLGAQIVASALGGKVVRREQGPELGITPLRRLPAAGTDAVLGGVPEGAPAPQWHWDEISELPPGAVPLLTGDGCRHQAFRVGELAWGVQFHPEVLAGEVAAWAANDGAEVRASGGDPDAAVASVRAAEPTLREVWGAAARAWGRVVQASVER